MQRSWIIPSGILDISVLSTDGLVGDAGKQTGSDGAR